MDDEYQFFKHHLIMFAIFSVVVPFILWDFFTGNDTKSEPEAIYLIIAIWIAGGFYLIRGFLRSRRDSLISGGPNWVFNGKEYAGGGGIPPRPEEWKFTFADLRQEMEEGKRKQIVRGEMEWAEDYERSLIPAGSRFPEKGDMYKAKIDLTASYTTSWAAPYSGGGDTTVYAGECFWIHRDSQEPKPVWNSALAVNYQEMEERIVSEEERSAAKYLGYSFEFSTISLNEDFELIETGYQPEESNSVL